MANQNNMLDLGCSAGLSEGVDDDFVGVIMNFVCALTLVCTASHIYIHYYNRHKGAATGVKTEFGMSLGYLFGGLVHGWMANRASDDDCASNYFYPVFAISYLSMVWSADNWLEVCDHIPFDARTHAKIKDIRFIRRIQKIRKCFIRPTLYLSAILLFTGATWCQLFSSVQFHEGNLDDCAGANPPALCDAMFATGEGIFYVFWVFVWVVVAMEVSYRELCDTFCDKLLNVLAPLALFVGPGQIFVVSAVAILLYGAGGQGQIVGLEWYCHMRVGVTYIIAVLLSHICSTLLMTRVLFKTRKNSININV